MNKCDRLYTQLTMLEGNFRAFILHVPHLHLKESGYHCKIIFHPVMDFSQQDILLMKRLADSLLRLFLDADIAGHKYQPYVFTDFITQDRCRQYHGQNMPLFRYNFSLQLTYCQVIAYDLFPDPVAI